MKRNNKSAIALIALSLLALSSGAAFAGHHWGNNDGMWQQGGSPLTTEQQATAQKIYDDYYTQTSALRQQLISKRYEYNALLTASSPDTAKINAVAKEMGSLGQKLDEQRVKRDVAMAQAGIPRGAGMGYGGCGGYGGGYHRGGGHMGMGNW
ncbi:zinc resistance-associated protein ZraP [Salmonella enterica subsp. enterica serovar Wilhelmsburg]|uniref:Zinc resistance-associated protein n=1 Tax=Salmonella enterica subsp. enterica serovar Wilhelmsburg TaxID=1960126 RepID=A0A659QTN4_SALET|nr:zinc resistance sensor/chaperone ZraP [Salmonella enterica]ELX9021446.1 zinc resistance sensor/chaperone ZraP [Salmonella enterica]TGC49972.1 zinc resistance-associated protein ZraP [Salmonella enterica subsp. enterica serovar Wilhelmsburg]TGC58057.1 zinc resistance-associated protein ZraP [Salmonella enterica subsp. enterica serovar Wilhelmsburg]TGC63427.1 zinc resistance-associated protein ZraP [Salmonella enterica subsp. enterica serovar Wilhelmsburg]TGC74078.1 zinc resistance-associated